MGLTVRELCPKAGKRDFPIDPAANVCMTNLPLELGYGSESAQWFALIVRHQHELRTQQALNTRGWETLLPTYERERQWSDRVKTVQQPLFSGYVFCRFGRADRMRVEDTPGVARIVEFAGTPAPLEDREIEEIRQVVTSRLKVSPWPYLKVGDRVRLERGPLRGLEGVLIETKDGARLVIGVELLRRALAVEVDPGMVIPLRVVTHAAS